MKLIRYSFYSHQTYLLLYNPLTSSWNRFALVFVFIKETINESRYSIQSNPTSNRLIVETLVTHSLLPTECKTFHRFPWLHTDDDGFHTYPAIVVREPPDTRQWAKSFTFYSAQSKCINNLLKLWIVIILRCCERWFPWYVGGVI